MFSGEICEGGFEVREGVAESFYVGSGIGGGPGVFADDTLEEEGSGAHHFHGVAEGPDLGAEDEEGEVQAGDEVVAGAGEGLTDDVEDVGAEERPKEAEEEGKDFVVAEFADCTLGRMCLLSGSRCCGIFCSAFRHGVLVQVLVLFKSFLWYVIFYYAGLGRVVPCPCTESVGVLSILYTPSYQGVTKHQFKYKPASRRSARSVTKTLPSFE